MTIDTRYQPRIDLETEVQIVHRSRSIRALSRNLSRGGVFLRTDATKIPSGTYIGMEFWIDDTRWQIDGLVVRQDEEGMGAIFKMPQPELYRTAANFNKASTGKPRRELRPGLKLANASRRKATVQGSNADL